MIYLSIKGRLGNQMFQYAFARALKEKLGQDILIDWHYVNDSDKKDPDSGFCNSLKDFNVSSFISINYIFLAIDTIAKIGNILHVFARMCCQKCCQLF